MIYLDTSALVKLVAQEPESAELLQWLTDVDDHDHVTSAVGRVELMRAALRSADTAIITGARRILDEDLDILAVTDDVIETAETIGPEVLRSLDAIHLASIAQLAGALTAVVAYDQRLVEGCRSLNVPVESPGAGR